MKIKSHIIFNRHKEKVHAGIDILSEAVFNDIKLRFEKRLGREISISTYVPKFDEYIISDDRFVHGVGAPRLWFDIYLDAPELNPKMVGKMLKNTDGKTDETNIIWEFVSCIDDIVPPCILAANISNPGVLSCIGSGVEVGDIYLESNDELANTLLESLEYARTLGWPAEISVTYADAIKWVLSILEKSPSVATNRVSRALAAFSHIATSRFRVGEYLKLFWAMMALESLYCEGNDGLKKQLFEKTSVIFGPIERNKKRIKQLYDFRSLFVHGELDLPFAFTDQHDDEHVRKFSGDIEEAESIAIRLLIASLQYLVKKQKTSLDFAYNLVEE